MSRKDWDKLLGTLKKDVPEDDFEAWFKPIQYLKSSDDTIYLSVPADFNKIWLTDNYLESMSRTLNNISGRMMDIQISIEEDGSGDDDSGPIIVKHERKNSSLEQLIPSYTFKRLIVGEHNNLAIAAAQKVAQNPGTAYNPLFLFGGVGLGKTHLMHAVGHELLKKDINTNVACVTSEEFMNLFIDSIRNKRQALFRKKFRNVDIFLLDDVQFLLRSGETRNELFNTFNTLHQKKKQIILTSDRSLKQLGLDGLDDRLVSRLGWGLDVEIHTPSIETKQAILYAKADEEKVSISNEVISFIAEVVESDIRELEKALTKVIAEYQLLKRDITLDRVRQTLKDYINDTMLKNISFDDIIRETANTFGISKADIKSKSRTSHVCQARQVVMYLSRNLTDMSLKEIAVELDKKHPTVISGVEKIATSLQKNPKLQSKLEEIKDNLNK